MKVKRVLSVILALLTALTVLSCAQTQDPETPGNDIPDTEETVMPSETDGTTETNAPATEATEPALPDLTPFSDDYIDVLPEDAENGLTLHAFNWTYREIEENLPAIRDAGFKNVLTMPVQQPKSGGNAWWAFYQPLSFSIGDQSAIGTKAELISLCAKAEEYGICILADIVVNHLATTDDEGKEEDGTPTVSPAVEAYEPIIYLNRNEDTDGTGVTFHHNKDARGSGAETQYYPYGNLPDLNTANAYVQERVLALLKECIDAGIDGFRFDAAKHVETAEDPDYPSDFWDNTLSVAKAYYTEKTRKNLYAYGEILGSPSGRSLSLYTSRMRITDDGFIAQCKAAFTLKDPAKILEASLKTSDAKELIAWVESHDEYVTTNTHYSNVRIARYWSIIAAKSGLGGLFLARPTDELTVGVIGSYGFESEYVAISNRFHNRFYDAESFESTDGTCYVNEKIRANDQGALILNVGDVDPDAWAAVAVPHLEDGIYYDALTGDEVKVYQHTAHLRFEANGLAIVTRTPSIYPSLDVSDRGGSFVGDKTITLKTRNCDSASYYFNGNASGKITFEKTAEISIADHIEDGRVVLHVELTNGSHTLSRSYTYTAVTLIENRFNVINLDEKYLNGDYELYIWSWNPGKWSKDYEIQDGVLLVDTEGLTGFLVAVFEKGYEIPNVNAWDSKVLKQSADIKGDILKEGFADLSGF